MSTKRKILLAAVVWAALAAVPPPSDADYRPMSDEQIASLTCGHLGVPCPPAHSKRSKCASASRHRKSRHARTRRARAHTADCRSAKKASKRRRAAAARHRS